MKSKLNKTHNERNKIISYLVLSIMLLTPINWGHAVGLSKEDFEAEITAYQEAEALRIKKETERIDSLKWNLFTEAIIWRESRGNANSIGDSGKAVGVLQIWPIMVDEANRVQKVNHFTYDDRYDREKSIDIFNAIQSHYNKGRDYDKALRIWNPKHPESYKRDIMTKFKQLQKENGIA